MNTIEAFVNVYLLLLDGKIAKTTVDASERDAWMFDGFRPYKRRNCLKLTGIPVEDSTSVEALKAAAKNQLGLDLQTVFVVQTKSGKYTTTTRELLEQLANSPLTESRSAERRNGRLAWGKLYKLGGKWLTSKQYCLALLELIARQHDCDSATII